MLMKYRHVFVGGTFDGLHAGHESVLFRAFREAKRVTIGLTSDLFIKKFKISNFQFLIIKNSIKISNSKLKIRDFTIRKHELEQWILNNKYGKRTHIIPINDPYEPAASGGFDALIVTKDNRKTGEEINRRRRKKGLKQLDLIEIPIVHAEDHAPISSTRVRNGEIDGNGRLVMPQSLIPALRKPLGKIIGEKDLRDKIKDFNGKIIITVGDQTTKTLLDQGIIPQLAIVDGMVGRKPFYDVLNMLQPQRVSPFEAIRVKSGPGFLATHAMKAVKAILERLERQEKRAMQEKHVIVVDGEEDLLALPAILYAPIGSVVLYGQPEKGIVMVCVTLGVKKKVEKLISQFI